MKHILQTIFSIKNTQRHKVLCILGLKFKFKRKKIKDKIDTTQLVILNTIKCFGEISEFLKNKAFFFLFGRGLRLNQKKIKLRNQVNLKTASGEYKTEYNPCLCGAHNDETLYIAVPTIETIPINYGNNIFNYLQNAHVYNFSEETLKYVIERAGFKSIDYVTELGCIIAKKTNKFREQNDVDESHYKYALDLLKRFDRDYFMGL